MPRLIMRMVAFMGLSTMMAWGCGCCGSFFGNSAYAQNSAKAGKCCELNIEGMTCEACAAHVQKALTQVTDVSEAKVSYAKGEASIRIRDGAKVTPEALFKAVEQAGYKATIRCYLLGIEGMTCENCAAHVQKALAHVPGVAEAKVTYAKGEASVCIRKGTAVTGETLVKAVEKAGYKATVK
jgi:Cu+-exporting ATPase